MKINKLLDGVDYVITTGSDDIWVDNITHIASDIKAGDCYIMLHQGEHAVMEANLAIRNGATIIISGGNDAINLAKNQIQSSEIRETYALMAKNYHNRRCDNLKIIGVVGSNGKSSTSYIIWSVLCQNKIRSGFIGTGFYMIGEIKYDIDSTTPDPMKLHNILLNMELSGVKIVVMEVSAHAIYLKKTHGISFDIGVFTNLSQDHLDYFVDMENLKKVKQSFFLDSSCKMSIINSDDSCGRELINSLEKPFVSYGINDTEVNESTIKHYSPVKEISDNVSGKPSLNDLIGENLFEISASNISWNNGVNNFEVTLLGKKYITSTKFIGLFNIYNILSAILAVKLCNVRIRDILSTIRDLEPLQGRGNILEYAGVKYIIDYAHSPDGLENIIKESRLITTGRVITVFGCGGDRDVSKRGVMGEIASSLSDIVIITGDNSRNEDKSSIMLDIYRGIRGDTSNSYMVKDRCEATLLANKLSRYNDTIILAGKGSEEYIEENGRKYKYSDKTTIEEILGIKWI